MTVGPTVNPTSWVSTPCAASASTSSSPSASVDRWSGRIAVLLTVPVIIHCVYALGFGTYSARVYVHSVLGCVFYGAFVAKMLGLMRRDTMPQWVMPVLGGAVFVSLIALWATSSLWLFATHGAHS